MQSSHWRKREKCAVRGITREKVKAMSDTTFHIEMQIPHNQNLCLLIGRKGYGIKHFASWTAQHVFKWHSKLKETCSSPVLHRNILIQVFFFKFEMILLIYQVRLNWNSLSHSFTIYLHKIQFKILWNLKEGLEWCITLTFWKDLNFAPTFPGPFEICSATRVDLYIVPFHSLKLPDVTAKQSKASYCQQ